MFSCDLFFGNKKTQDEERAGVPAYTLLIYFASVRNTVDLKFPRVSPG